jgi:predicted nucleic acid-binding protein
VEVSRFCLDTSAYSRFRRGDADVARLIDEAEWIGVPAVVLGELRVGFRLGAQAERNEILLREFIANPVVQVLPVDGDISHQYADIAIELRRAGTPIPTNDMWIAATAAGAGAIVLTSDDHFSAVGRVGSVVLADA